MRKRLKKYKLLLSFLSSKIPFISSFLILILSFTNFGFYTAKPMLILIPIFFWRMHKVDALDFISIMFFGFIQDFLDGTGFSINIFILFSLYFIVYYQKIFKINDSFVFSYLAFTIISFILLLIKYLIIILLFIPNVGFFNTLLSWAVLLIAYPIFYYILNWLYIKIVSKY